MGRRSAQATTHRAGRRVERHRRKAHATPRRKAARVPRSPRRPVGAARTPFSRSPPSPRMRPDDLDGGTGVPEPRWSSPSMPALALELDIPEAQYLEMSTQPA
jgi:hypothetical protein